MDDKEIVSALRASVADKVGQERFDLWLGTQSRLTIRGEALLIELPSRFAQDWVRQHFRREIESASIEVLGRPLALEFRVDTGLACGAAARQREARQLARSLSRGGPLAQ